MNSGERGENKEKQTLDRRESGSAEHLAEHDGRSRDRRDKNGQQETFFAVLNDRHHGEDRGEEHDQDQSTRVEVVEIMLLASAGRLERGAEAGAQYEPEDQR